MKLSRWFLLIGSVVGLGLFQVTLRNAIFMQGYAVGERVATAHRETTEVAWLEAKLVGLSSPGHLSDTAEKQKLKLVAWSVLEPPQAPQVLAALKSSYGDLDEQSESSASESVNSALSSGAVKTQVALSPSDD